MNGSSARLIAATLCIAALCYVPAGLTVSAQNQTPQNQSAQNQTPRRPAGNQSAAAPGNKTPEKPAEPPPVPGTPLYISPGVVQMIQQKLISLGYPMPTTSGAWGENSAAGLAQFQRKEGLDPGGDLDERTLNALGMAQVLTGDLAPAAASDVAPGNGAPLSVSPQLTRVLQNKLTEAGFPPHNIFGIWISEIDNAPRNYQKAKGLDVTNTLDLQLIHSLGLTDSLLNPKPSKLPSDSITSLLSEDNLLLTGEPLSISAIGLRQIQTALADKVDDDIKPDGKWSDAMSAALKKFQEAQKLEPTGSLNLRTLKALGFANPLMELDRPGAPKS